MSIAWHQASDDMRRGSNSSWLYFCILACHLLHEPCQIGSMAQDSTLTEDMFPTPATQELRRSFVDGQGPIQLWTGPLSWRAHRGLPGVEMLSKEKSNQHQVAANSQCNRSMVFCKFENCLTHMSRRAIHYQYSLQVRQAIQDINQQGQVLNQNCLAHPPTAFRPEMHRRIHGCRHLCAECSGQNVSIAKDQLGK